MGDAGGFEYEPRGSGDVVITHRGRRATTLRGARAEAFLNALADGADAQQPMARMTGNYKRGNERQAMRQRRDGRPAP